MKRPINIIVSELEAALPNAKAHTRRVVATIGSSSAGSYTMMDDDLVFATDESAREHLIEAAEYEIGQIFNPARKAKKQAVIAECLAALNRCRELFAQHCPSLKAAQDAELED